MKGIIRGKQEITAICIIVLASILGLVLRWQGIWEESGDFQSCLSIWMDHLKSGNGIRVLSQYTGDYNMPYVTILPSVGRFSRIRSESILKNVVPFFAWTAS